MPPTASWCPLCPGYLFLESPMEQHLEEVHKANWLTVALLRVVHPDAVTDEPREAPQVKAGDPPPMCSACGCSTRYTCNCHDETASLEEIRERFVEELTNVYRKTPGGFREGVEAVLQSLCNWFRANESAPRDLQAMFPAKDSHG